LKYKFQNNKIGILVIWDCRFKNMG